MHCDPDTPIPEKWFLSWTLFESDLRYKGRSSSSITNYRCAVACLPRCLVRHGITDPEQVTRRHLRLYLGEQREARQRAGLLALHKALSVFWKWFAGEYETENPMAGIGSPQVTVPPVAVFTEDELKKILKAVAGKDAASLRDAAIVWLLLETGLRRTELISLNVTDFGVRNWILRIRPETAKGGKGPMAWVGDQSYTALVRWMRRRPDGDALFTSYNGRRLSYAGIGKILHRIGAKAGVDDVRPATQTRS